MAYDKKQMVQGDKIIEYTNDFEDRVESGFGGTDTEIEALKQKDIALEEKDAELEGEINKLKVRKGYNVYNQVISSAITVNSASTVILTGLPTLEIDVKSDNSLVFIQGFLMASVNREVGNITLVIDGVNQGRVDSTNLTTPSKLIGTTIMSLDKGKHKIQFGGYVQSTNATMTIPAWNTVSLLAFEL